LLVLSAVADPPLAIQGVQLWQGIAGGLRHDATLHERLLAVEGGESLRHQALIEDALAALACLEPTLDTERLFALLASPYFNFASVAEGWGLQGWFEQRGRARWERGSLRTALTAAAPRHPAANRLLAWLEALWQLGAVTTPLPAATWAGQFSDVLAAAGFGSSPGLDSREQQRLARWSALLDEFAGLDAVLPPLHAREALVQLGRLAAQGRHQGASGDAAVTLSDGLGDPVIDYDGIWVLGLAETRWPPPPRPDPYVALAEQRRSHWPESSAGEQRAQAAWALARWQRRTRELVLSHAEMEGDLRHRPTSLLGATAGEWRAEQGEAALPTLGQGQVASDQSFPPLAASTLDKPLGGGVERLRVQRDCPFRAHAQWRLAARAPDPLSDGVTATLRGRLLHLLLQGLWGELRTQQRLLALDPPAERELLERHWREALRHPGAADAAWLPERVLAREHRRALRLVARVLELERQRAPFEVVGRERELTWPEQGARLTLRIDRIDRTATGERLLIDYKSGAPRGLALHKGELEPLQLAVYAAALADRGEPVTGAALLGLAPGELGYASAGRDAGLLPGMKPVDDWDGTTQRWRAELLRLLEEHLAGGAPLAAGLEACRYCHLPALCRRATDDAAEDDDVS
jgi:probable DNA repair protein